MPRWRGARPSSTPRPCMGRPSAGSRRRAPPSTASPPARRTGARVAAETLGARRARAQIATKVWAGSAREGREQIRQAREWYGGKVDLYQIHNLTAWREHLPYLEELRAQGTVGAIGITHYSSSAFREMAAILETGRVTAIQGPLNPME